MQRWRCAVNAAAILGVFGLGALPAFADAAADAKKMFLRLTGTPLVADDPRLAQMAEKITAGRPLEAARIATGDKNFYNITLRNWAAPWSVKDGAPDAPFDDMQATAVGIVRDELDGRLLLTGRVAYRGRASGLPAVSAVNNDHYSAIETQGLDLGATLERVEVGVAEAPEAAGVLTSRAFAKEYLLAGTNRRAVVFAIQNYLCTPIQAWRDPGLPETFVRRDVNRAPSGNPAAYQRDCRTCHAPMDAMAGAFAHFDFDGTRLVSYGPFNVAPKYNIHTAMYPDGYETTDDSWENFATRHHNVALGWRSATEGHGIAEFGAMLAASEAFSRCMAKRAFEAVCRRAPAASDQGYLNTAAERLENEDYNLRMLFEYLAVEDRCQ
jgi:hypothetical protein